MSPEVPDFPPESERHDEQTRWVGFEITPEELAEHGVINPDDFVTLAYTPPKRRGKIELDITPGELREALDNPGSSAWQETLQGAKKAREQFGKPQ